MVRTELGAFDPRHALIVKEPLLGQEKEDVEESDRDCDGALDILLAMTE